MLSGALPATPPATPRRSPSDATAASPSAVAPTTEPCGSTRDSRGSLGSQRQESRGSSQHTHKRRRHDLSAAADSNGVTLDQFFARVDKPRPERDVSSIAFEEDALDDDEAEATAAASPGMASCASPDSPPDRDALEQQVKQLSAELDELRSVALELDHAQRRLTHAEHSTELLRRALTVQVRELARQERLSMARKTAAQCERLGHVTVIRTGTTLQEAWEDGTEFRHLAERTAAITAQREAIDRSRKELTRLRKPPAHGDAPPTPAAPAMVHYIMEQEETFKIRLQHLRREEASLAEERARLECEKATLMRELKRVRDENASRFNDFPLLTQRYLLMAPTAQLLERSQEEQLHSARHARIPHSRVAQAPAGGLPVRCVRDRRQLLLHRPGVLWRCLRPGLVSEDEPRHSGARGQVHHRASAQRPAVPQLAAVPHHPLRPQARQHPVHRRRGAHYRFRAQQNHGRRLQHAGRHGADLAGRRHVLVLAAGMLRDARRRGRRARTSHQQQGGRVELRRHLLPDVVWVQTVWQRADARAHSARADHPQGGRARARVPRQA
eukprot:ctg_173.g81